MKQEMRLLIFGPPGCGKGTLSKFITQKSHLTHISMGEMIRDHIAAHDDIGTQAEKIVSKGQLIPDDITNAMMQERLTKDDAKHSFLLDGYPRDVYQAEFITKLTTLTGVIVMTLTDELIMTRLMARGRADDTKETIKDRIKLYKETTSPVLEFLKNKQVPIIEINGDYDINTQVDGIVKKIINWQETIVSKQ